jgi:RHS repeat-associated protein
MICSSVNRRFIPSSCPEDLHSTWSSSRGARQYSYDALGNLTGKAVGTPGATNQTYDPMDRPHAVKEIAGPVGYAYDADGNVTQKGAQHFTFDPDNRLTCAGTTPGGCEIASFGYDLDGDRVFEESGDGSHTRIFLGELFEWDPATDTGQVNVFAFGERIWQRTHEEATLVPAGASPAWPGSEPPGSFPVLGLLVTFSGGLLVLYWQLQPIEHPTAVPPRAVLSVVVSLALILLPARLHAGGGGSGGTTYDRAFVLDHLGSNALVLQGNGFVIHRRVLAPFGSLVAETSNPPEETPRRFTGHDFEGMTGLYDFEARWYDPDSGRFFSADPILASPWDPQGVNPYSYVSNNPLNLIDPTGLEGIGLGASDLAPRLFKGRNFGGGDALPNPNTIRVRPFTGEEVTAQTPQLVAQNVTLPAQTEPAGPAAALSARESQSISRGANAILSDEQVGNSVFNETRSLSGPGINDARRSIANIIINGDEALGAQRPTTASTVLPRNLSTSEQATLQSIRALVTDVRAQRAAGIDPTNDARFFGFRDITKFRSGFEGLATVRRFGTQVPIRSGIVGPFNNSFPTPALGPTGVFFVPFE